MAGVGKNNQSSSVRGIASSDGSIFLLSDRLASLNFNGFIPRSSSPVYVSDLTPGQTIFNSDPSSQNSSFFITKISSVPVTVDGVEENAYFLYFLGEENLEEQYTYGAENEDGSFSQNHLFSSYRDDISNLSIGTDGWMITNQGNAVFSNVFVRGAIEATSGKIDGILNVGEGLNGEPLVTIGKNIFESTAFEGSSSEHSGIFLDKHNYFMGYDEIQSIPILSVVAENSTNNVTLRKAVFTLASHTLSVRDKVSISGFTEDKFLELEDTFSIAEVTQNTFTVYYKNEIAGTTNPISVNLKADSFGLDNISTITELNLSNVVSTENTSILKIYIDKQYTGNFEEDFSITVSSSTSPVFAESSNYLIDSIVVTAGEDDPDYLLSSSLRVPAGTYTTGLGQINSSLINYKFKVGNNINSMSYNSFTGALSVTGTINADSGNFTNNITIGKQNISYSIYNKKLLDNVATLTTSTIHNFVIGDSVVISGVDATFNGTYTITGIPTIESFTYAKTATNVASTAVSPVGKAAMGEAENGSLSVGYGTNQITINGTGTDTTSAIFAGVGNYGNADTAFFMDASGRFSLKDKLTFTGGNLTVSGTVNASAGNFTETVTIGQSSTQGKLKVGTGTSFFEIIGTNNIETTAIKTNNSTGYNTAGVWIGADGKFSLGNNQLYFDGANLFAPAITTTSLTVGTSPNQMIMSPTAIPGSPSVPGLYMTKTKDFISATTGNFSLGQTGLVWDGTTLNVNGILTGYINQTYAAPIIPANTMGVGSFKNFTNISGTLSGTTLTVSEADRLKLSIGSPLTKVSGTGVFGTSTVVESILSSTEVKVTPTAGTNGAIVFNSNNAADGIYGTGLKINQYNYWFADSPGPRLKVGDATNYLEYGSGNLTVTGTINATAGNFTNTVYVGNNATGSNNIQIIGTPSAATTAIGIGTGTLAYNTATTKFWADASGRFSLGNNFSYNGSGITITGGSNTSSTFFNTTNSPVVTVSVSGDEGQNILNAGSGVNFVTSGFFVGMFVTGAGIKGATYVKNVTTSAITLSETLFDSCSSVTGYKYAFSTGGSTLENGLFAVDYQGNVKATTGTFGDFKLNEDGFRGKNNPLEWSLYGQTEVSLLTGTDNALGLSPGVRIFNNFPITYFTVIAKTAQGYVGVAPWGDIVPITYMTIYTDGIHSFDIGTIIEVDGLSFPFDGTWEVINRSSNAIAFARYYFQQNVAYQLDTGLVSNLTARNTELTLTKEGISVWGENNLTPTTISPNTSSGVTIQMGTTDAAVGYADGGIFSLLDGTGDVLIQSYAQTSGGVGSGGFPSITNIMDTLTIESSYYNESDALVPAYASLDGTFNLGGPLYVNRMSGTAANLTAGVIASNSGWVWAHRNGTATNSSIFATSGYLAGAWRGIQFLRSLTSGASMSNTGYISVALSTTVAPSFAAGSDYRLKTNIRTAEDDFIDKISSLRLVRFDEIAVEENTNQLGFIAHEVQEVIPEAIEGEKDAVDENGDPDYQHIMQIRILPYLVGALQESIKKVEDLENRLAALES